VPGKRKRRPTFCVERSRVSDEAENVARVLVTGASGLLGSTLVPVLMERGHEVVRLGRARPNSVNTDLRDADAAWRALEATAPEIIVNLVAATNVDDCERDRRLAYAVNTQVVANIVRWVASRGGTCHLVQISTDQLYDGEGPHTEDGVCPINYYALSKYAAELIAGNVPSTVLRTNFFGKSRCPGRASLSDWLVSVMRRQERATVFEDVLFTPLSLETLSRMIAIVLEQGIPGIFNLGSMEGMSKAEFAFRLADSLDLPTDTLVRGMSSAVEQSAPRPKDMRMNNTLFESRFRIKLPTLQSEIKLMRDAYATQA
jgi:dTDP-4-dehydrorhamnose reductase